MMNEERWELNYKNFKALQSENKRLREALEKIGLINSPKDMWEIVEQALKGEK